MATLSSEYDRFLSYLAAREVDDDVRRFAHLVRDNLQTLVEVGATRRGRSTRLAPLAVVHLAQIAVVYGEAPPAAEPETSFGRLQKLEVGPFRGFMRREVFDLSHNITLVYGANGTGKSSFCEAMEVAMLGSISEAQAKRLDQRVYCNNARLNRHVAPLLSAGVPSLIQVVQPNETEYRFCFIEKNRLDNFARIAARTPGDQRQLIATLFGVEQFSDFVRGFNPSLDQELMLIGTHAAMLSQRRLQLGNSEQAIAAHPQKIAEIEQLERGLAQRMSPSESYQACVAWLLGTDQQLGRLPYVVAQLDSPTPFIHEVTQTKLESLLAEVYRLHALWLESNQQLASRAGDVSYAKLYEAVSALADGATVCPACGTSLESVAQDPFAKARAGLAQLAQLASLQERERLRQAQLADSLRTLLEEMRRVVEVGTDVCSQQLQQSALPKLPPASVGTWLSAWVDGERQAWNALLRVAKTIENKDTEARMAHGQRSALAQERNRLDQYRLDIERFRTMRITADRELASATQTIAQFDDSNRELIHAVEAEVPIVAHHQRVKAAYDRFLPEIQSYLASLPGVLLSGLGERARNLFNAFNRSDNPGDLLNALWLPVAENGKIEVEFAGELGIRYDALIVFSEGHIKCLGLAILLAKNIEQDCPVVIFDDVVNAIDDDHRDGIWRTFFEDDLLDGKQVILTSHAEEFLHRIQQELGARRAAAIKRYKFLPHRGEHQLYIDTDPPTKNYVLLAQMAIGTDDKREALRQARPALESLTDQLWTWLGRRTDARLELKLSGPRSPWELNNKCSKLRSAFDRVAAQHAGAPDVVAAIARLLGVGAGSIEWGYLNSGVHDSQQDHEFDRATVETVIEAITALDTALATLRGR